MATGLPSCLDKPAEGGPDYSNGSTVVCAYPTTATSVSTDANRSSCTPIDASSNFAPKVTCSYDAASTTQHVATCTNIPQSSSGTYAGPATVCSYGPETVAARNLNAPFCTPNRQSSGTYNNDAVDCTYNGTATTTSVTSCSDVDNSGSAYYAGPKTVCHEGAAYGTWANVTAGTCVTAGQSGPPNYTQWRDCQYTPLTVQGHSNVCNEVAASGPPNYSVLIPVHCVAGSYLTQTTTTSGTVDYCSTDPTQVGDTGSHQEQVNTTTTCTPASPTIANATSCTEKPACLR